MLYVIDGVYSLMLTKPLEQTKMRQNEIWRGWAKTNGTE